MERPATPHHLIPELPRPERGITGVGARIERFFDENFPTAHPGSMAPVIPELIPDVAPEALKPEHPLHPGFMENDFTFRRKIFTLFGDQFKISSPDGRELMYSRQKPFRLREDYRIFADRSSDNELLRIKTPNFIDAWAKFDVEDTQSGRHVGSLKRKWLRSMLRDDWVIMDGQGNETGRLHERSYGRAFASKLLGSFFVPESYVITDNAGNEVASIMRSRNPIAVKFDMKITSSQPTIDRRLLVSTGIVLAGFEAKMDDESAHYHHSSSESGSSS